MYQWYTIRFRKDKPVKICTEYENLKDLIVSLQRLEKRYVDKRTPSL